MEVKVSAPATCGEFVQGIWRSQPCLVSAPIDIYSTTHIKEGNQEQKLDFKAETLINSFFNKYGINRSYLNGLNISINSPIPKSIGMGSSTADLASLTQALATYFFVDISEQEIGKILTDIEPTDNSFFSNLNLFNQYNGSILYSFNSFIKAKLLLILREDFKVDTLSFSYNQEFKREEKYFQPLLEMFNFGLKNEDLNLIGEASTGSYILNQRCLKDPSATFFLSLRSRYNLPGLICGHTGSIIGLILDKETNTKEILKDIHVYNEMFPQKGEFQTQINHIVKGGLSVETIYNKSN